MSSFDFERGRADGDDFNGQILSDAKAREKATKKPVVVVCKDGWMAAIVLAEDIVKRRERTAGVKCQRRFLSAFGTALY